MRGRLRRTLAALLVLLPLLPACGILPPVDRSPERTPAATVWPVLPAESPKALWTLSDVLPFSAPEKASGLVLIVLVERGVPYLTALDPATGKRRWRRPMTPAFVRRGIRPAFHVAGNQVAFLAPDAGRADLTARLVIADATTGADLANTAALEFTSYPDACDDGSGDVCASTRGGPIRFRVDARDHLADPAAVPDTYPIGPHGLVQFQDTEPRRLGVVRDGKLRWSARFEELFGRGSTPDWGWGLDLHAESDVYYGGVGIAPPKPVDGVITESLARLGSSADFRASDGRPVWSAPGWQHRCGLADDLVPAVLQCRFTGTLRSYPDERRPDVDITGGVLRRIDPGHRRRALVDRARGPAVGAARDRPGRQGARLPGRWSDHGQGPQLDAGGPAHGRDPAGRRRRPRLVRAHPDRHLSEALVRRRRAGAGEPGAVRPRGLPAVLRDEGRDVSAATGDPAEDRARGRRHDGGGDAGPGRRLPLRPVGHR